MTDALGHQKTWYRESIPLRDQVVVDVGANIGELSQLFWDAGEGTNRVISVEPLDENVARIRERIAAAGSDKWTVVQGVISDTEGEASLRVGNDPEEGWNSVVVPGQGMRTVESHRLSTLVPDATVVKLDIEGHEYVVLDEAVTNLKQVHTWAIEFHLVPSRPLQDALGKLAAAGFKLFAAGRNPKDPAGGWMSAPIPPQLTWDPIPVAKTRPDGTIFKMVHVLARR